jgi:hypothetical protein
LYHALSVFTPDLLLEEKLSDFILSAARHLCLAHEIQADSSLHTIRFNDISTHLLAVSHGSLRRLTVNAEKLLAGYAHDEAHPAFHATTATQLSTTIRYYASPAYRISGT